MEAVKTSIRPTIPNITENVSNFANGFKQSIGQTLNQFSEIPDASQSFVQSNTIVSKFAFIVLIVIIFMFLLSLGMSMINTASIPSSSPFVVNGTINGNSYMHVSRDPKQPNSVTLLKSNNMQTGLEFTWSLWIYLDTNTNTNTKYSHVFSVGNNIYDPNTGIATVNNAPGVYILNGNDTGTMHIVMDVVAGQAQTVDITGIPFRKWVNVVIRMENTIMDIYVNNVITNRTTFKETPKQNFGDIYVCDNGGFSGSLSSLQYFDHALNIFQIKALTTKGPNLSAVSTTATNTSALSSGYNYLSSQWYTALQRK